MQLNYACFHHHRLPSPELQELIDKTPWQTTLLGPRENWHPSLQSAVQTLLSQPTATLLLWGPGLVQIYNDAYAKIAGDQHPRCMGQSFFECCPEYVGQLRPHLHRVLAGDSVQIEDSTMSPTQKNSSEDFFFSFSLSPLRDEKGVIQGVWGIVSETTNRIRAERARARIEKERETLVDQQRIVLDASQLGWWSLDPEKNLIYWDKRGREIYGIDTDPVDYSLCIERMHPEDRQKVAEAVRLALDPNDPRGYFIEYRVIRDDGVERWVQSTGKGQFRNIGGEQKPYGFYGTVADITEAKKTEATIRENTQRVRIALAASKLGDWDWDPKKDLLTLSPRMLEIFGLPTQQNYLAADMRGCICPEDREAYRLKLQDSIEKQMDYQIEYRILRGNEDVWIAENGHGLYDSDGVMIRMIGVVKDITDRKNDEVEREILLARERVGRAEAEHASQMKDDFLTTLSHELRTPLNAIVGWSQLLLRQSNLATDVVQGLQTIARNGRVQAQIIEDLLDMSRIVSGKLNLDMQQIDIIALVKQGVETIRPSAETKGLQVNTRIPDEVVTVKADPNRLQQVVWNLLTNAVKFTPPQGTIEISSEYSSSHVHISVADTGIGIPANFLPYVFDRFRQADASTTRRYGGLGLGLSIVKQLTELHGGSVRVESQGEGKGTCFVLSFPLFLPGVAEMGRPELGSTRATSTMTEDEQTRVARRLRNIRVLVVDDEHDSRMLVKRVLEDYKVTVETAASVAEALEKFSISHFDILVSDIGMPGEDGYSLIQKIRKIDHERSKIPAIALTAYARSEDQLKAIRSGFQNHIIKPIEPVELLTVIANLAPVPTAET